MHFIAKKFLQWIFLSMHAVYIFVLMSLSDFHYNTQKHKYQIQLKTQNCS